MMEDSGMFKSAGLDTVPWYAVQTTAMDRESHATIPLLGALAAGFLASACCTGPLIFMLLGLGSASAFAALEPYRPFFAAFTLGLLGWAAWRHWQARKTCPAGGCPTKRPVLPWLLGGLALLMLATPNLLALLATSEAS